MLALMHYYAADSCVLRAEAVVQTGWRCSQSYEDFWVWGVLQSPALQATDGSFVKSIPQQDWRGGSKEATQLQMCP